MILDDTSFIMLFAETAAGFAGTIALLYRKIDQQDNRIINVESRVETIEKTIRPQKRIS